MGLGRPLRVAHRLAANADPILEHVRRGLADAGVDTIVDDARADLDIVFACGLLTRELIASGVDLEPVAAPVFPGESTAVYRTVFVTREEDSTLDLLTASSGHRMAVNEYGSWSGWNAYLCELEPLGIAAPPPERRGTTGSHVASMRAVTAGRFDFAAIDSSVWTHHLDESGRLVVFATGRDWPAPPISVGPAVDDDARECLTSLPEMRPVSATDYDEMYECSRRVR